MKKKKKEHVFQKVPKLTSGKWKGKVGHMESSIGFICRYDNKMCIMLLLIKSSSKKKMMILYYTRYIKDMEKVVFFFFL